MSLASLPEQKRTELLAELSDAEAAALLTDWHFWGRPDQFAPEGDWLVWLILAGRGWGKTRTGAEWIAERIRENPGCRIALVAETFADGRDTMMEGESGLLAVLSESELRGGSREAAWNRSIGELYCANGSYVHIYSAEKPGKLRGPQHHFAWCDEIAKWADAPAGADADDSTWSNLMLGLRLGDDPRCVATTTPRPFQLIRDLLADDMVVTTKGTTYDNLANLAAPFRRRILKQYEGTRLGRQELLAEMLDDVPGAAWSRADIDASRVERVPVELTRIAVGVDPSVTSRADSAETGIIVAGLGTDGHAYVLDDRSRRDTPNGWGRAAVAAYHTHDADLMVAEVNNGGEMVELTVRTVDKTVNYKAVHAQKGKAARAEPIAALYEQGRVHHVGSFDKLEDQMCSWIPGAQSPDRLDAAVWVLTELMLDRDFIFSL